ncbi:MAG: helix-turn-helix domain-containing protein, partial [Paludibacteraceae bacterium]|nr:helix-turn-helix domain-containing protein [Paludibacteraceae bacterium]
MEVQVHEYAWMWQRLGLSLAECRVFAFIYGLTKSKKYGGYDGSKRQLAAMLGLSKSQICNVINSLQEKQLIDCIDSKWQSVQSVDKGVQSVDESVQSVDESVQSVD